MESPRVQFNPTDPSTYFLPKKDNVASRKPINFTRGYTYLIHEPLIAYPMEPSHETDPLSIDESTEVSDASFAESSFSGIDIFNLFERETKSLPSTPISSSGELVKVKEDPDGSVHIKEEPSVHNQSLNRSGREILAEALNTVTFLCPKCKYRSDSKEDVLKHFSMTHIRFIERPCDLCSYIGKTKRDIASHKKMMHPRVEKFQKHDMLTLPTGEYKCTKCEFRSFYRVTITKHLAMHDGERKFRCDKCPFETMHKVSMVYHQRRHMDLLKKERYPLKCPHCGIAEKTQESLSNHLAWHGEGEMHKCDLCPFTTAFKPGLGSHIRLCHGISSKKYERRELPSRKIPQGEEVPEREEPIVRKRPYVWKNKGPYTGKKRGRKPKNWKLHLNKSTHTQNRKTDVEKEERSSENKTLSDNEMGNEYTDESPDEEDVYVPQGHLRYQQGFEPRRSTRATRNSRYTDGDSSEQSYSYETRNNPHGIPALRRRGRPRRVRNDSYPDSEPPEKRQRIDDDQNSQNETICYPAIDTTVSKEENTAESSPNKQIETEETPSKENILISECSLPSSVQGQEFNDKQIQDEEISTILKDQGSEQSQQNDHDELDRNKAFNEDDSLKEHTSMESNDQHKMTESKNKRQSEDSSSSSSSSSDDDSDDTGSSTDDSSETSHDVNSRDSLIPQNDNPISENDESSRMSCDATTRDSLIPQITNSTSEHDESSKMSCDATTRDSSIPQITNAISENDESSQMSGDETGSLIPKISDPTSEHDGLSQSATELQETSCPSDKNVILNDGSSSFAHEAYSIDKGEVGPPLPQETRIRPYSPEQNALGNVLKPLDEKVNAIQSKNVGIILRKEGGQFSCIPKVLCDNP